MPHGITQCYLPPGRGDIPALMWHVSARSGEALVANCCIPFTFTFHCVECRER